jgi:5-methylthioribose kinase
MSEEKDKKPEDFTIPELLQIIDELVSNEQVYIEEIARLKKELEDNQNG